MTREQERILNDYKRATFNTIHECYKAPSIYKERAERYILQEKFKNSGYDYRVISYNAQMFTCGYKMIKNNNIYLIYHTATKRVEIPLSI